MADSILKDLKTLKGIDDDLQDNLLNLIIKQSKEAILSRINRERKEPLKEVPSNLDWIILEVSVRRFNRLNSEGMKSKSEEGSKLEWDSLLEEYIPDLKPYMDDEKDKSKKGVFRIW